MARTLVRLFILGVGCWGFFLGGFFLGGSGLSRLETIASFTLLFYDRAPPAPQILHVLEINTKM